MATSDMANSFCMPSDYLSWHLIWHLHFNDATFSLCGAVWRAESAAAHWEYRMNPLVRRENVRAFAMRHACAHPSLCLCLSPSLGPGCS